MSNITAYYCNQDAYNSPDPSDSNFTSEEASKGGNEEARCQATWSNIQSQQPSLHTSDAISVRASNPDEENLSSLNPTTCKVDTEIHYWKQLSLLTRASSSSSGHPSFNPWSPNPPIGSNRFSTLTDLTVTPREAFLDYDNVSNILEEEAIRRASLSNTSGIANSTKTDYPTPLHGTSYFPEPNLPRSPLPSSKKCSVESSSKLQRKGSIMSHSKQASIETAASFDLPPHCVPKNAIRWMPGSSSSRPSLIGGNETRSEAELAKSTEIQDDQVLSSTVISLSTKGESSLPIEPLNLQCDTSQPQKSPLNTYATLPDMLNNCADDFSSTSEEDLTRPPSPNVQILDQSTNKFDVDGPSSLLDPHSGSHQISETQSQPPIPSLERMNQDRDFILSQLLLTENDCNTVNQDPCNRSDTNHKTDVIQAQSGQKTEFEEIISDDTLPIQTHVESSHLESMKTYAEDSADDSANLENSDKKESTHEQDLLHDVKKGKRSNAASSSTTSPKRKGPARSTRKTSLREKKDSNEECLDSWSDHEYDDTTSKSIRVSRRINPHSILTSKQEYVDDSSSVEEQNFNSNTKRRNSGLQEESDHMTTRRVMSSSRLKAKGGSGKTEKSGGLKRVTRNRRTSTSSATTRSVRGQSTYKMDQSHSDGIRCEHVDETNGITCNTVFRRPYDLARHKETIHDLEGSGSGRKPQWICKECEGCFSRKDALIRHCRIRNHQSSGKM